MTENKNQNSLHSGPKLNDQMIIRREKLDKIRALGVEPYGQKFEWDHHAADIRKEAEQLEKDETHVRIAGRIMIRRGQGKTAFCVLRDQTGDIQVYFKRDELPENEWALAFLPAHYTHTLDSTHHLYIIRCNLFLYS